MCCVLGTDKKETPPVMGSSPEALGWPQQQKVDSGGGASIQRLNPRGRARSIVIGWTTTSPPVGLSYQLFALAPEDMHGCSIAG